MSHVLRSRIVRTLLVLVTCAILTSVAFAQSGVDGAIGGTVTDPSKAVVPNAKVTVRNVETNATSTATTDAEGKFRIQRLQPGIYEVKVEAPNFAVRTEPRVVVEVGRITGVEPTLSIGGTSEMVEVGAEAPTVNTLQQDFSSNINQTSINELPINGRRWSNFALLAPAATPDGGFGLISFRGISGLLNNSTVDGGDNNQAFFSEERGRTRISYVISQASVREFQVNTSNYSAEYGRAAGGVVNSVTKSGTNNIHGSAFYYIRDNALGAYNPFAFETVKDASGNYVQNRIKPKDRRQQFGGSIGGPIVKDKLFFFFSYDQQKRNYPGTAQMGTPSSIFAPMTASERSSLRSKMGIASSDPLGDQKATAAFDAGLAFLQAETGVVPRKGDQNIMFPKIDYRINDKHTLAVSYNRMRWEAPAGVQSQPVVSRGIASFGDDYVKVDTMTARLSSALSNTVSNELRYSWGRDFEFQRSQPNSAVEQALLAKATRLGPLGRMPSVSVASSAGITIGKPNFLERAMYPEEIRNQWANNTTWANGKHLVKFGVDINRVEDTLDQLYQEGGAYSYSTRIDFFADLANAGVAGAPKNWSSYNQGFGPTKWYFSTWDYNFYIQDDYRLHPRLTVNFGVRYEYEQMPDAQVCNPALSQSCKFPRDKNNFGPRFGFAWDPFGDSKTAVRGGYGIYYGRIINSTISSALNSTGVEGSQQQINYRTSDASAPSFPNVAVRQAGKQDVVVFARDAQVPQIHQADLIVEREIAKNTVVSASYILSLGRELVNFYDMNLSPATVWAQTQFEGGPYHGMTYRTPIYTQRPNTNYGRITNIVTNVNSNYNAAVLQLNRRMTNGLQFQTSYTWAHALDSGQNSTTFTTGNALYDIARPELEYGTSNFDIRHKFVASVIYAPTVKFENRVLKAILSDWTVSPIVNISSGRPYTENIGSNLNGLNSSGVANVRGVAGFNGGGGTARLAELIGRNSFRYPRTANVDLRLSRRVKIAEGHKVEFLAEAFNLFNRLNVTGINNRMYNYDFTTSSPTFNKLVYVNTFGTANEAGNTIYRERQIQFALRYEF